MPLAPAGAQCVDNVRALPNGCYYFDLWRKQSVQYDCKIGFHLQSTKFTRSCSTKSEESFACQSGNTDCYLFCLVNDHAIAIHIH